MARLLSCGTLTPVYGAQEPCPGCLATFDLRLALMTLEEKVGKTLEELGVKNAAGVRSLFADVHKAMEAERRELRSQRAADAPELKRLVKALRDRWLARKNGILASIDEHWLKLASKDLKPVVGREFNELRGTAA